MAIMLDAGVSNILEKLTSIGLEKLKEEVKLLAGVEGEVEKLRLTLNAIQAVAAGEATLQLMKKVANNAWLVELKKVAYDIEDVLDTWDTAMKLKSSAVEDRSTLAAFEHKRKVCKWSFLSSCCFRVSEVGLRHDIGREIKTLNEKLNDIAALQDRYHSSSDLSIEQTLEHLETTFIINVTEVKGREKDKDKLINMLLSESSKSDTPNLHTISLVGVGGIGKTTLAKLASNDDKVKVHFSKRLWVCVSDPFEEIKIAKAILESLKGANSKFDGLVLNTLVKEIVQSIEGNKFLLVLDDVWNKESKKWEQLKCSLMRGAPGSRILVTTRNEEVAKTMGSTESDIFRLGLLSDEECWSIFSLQVAFSERNNREREQLEETGKKIVEKCKGLPLAAKTLGGLLRFKISKEEWERVLNSELWQLKEPEIERDLFAPLCLSYYDLSLSLRQCFSHCATFPKDHEIIVDELIELWMAQGFLREIPNKDMKILGEEYFQNLAVRSFFQDFKKEWRCGIMIRSCKMHDIVHDFAQFVSKDECFSMEKYESKDPSKQFMSKETRHLYIAGGINQNTLSSLVCNLEKLRSLFIFGDYLRLHLVDLDALMNQLIYLRSLCLKRCDIKKLPSSINCLIHLRYLDLSSNHELKNLPKEICDLINLQTLNVSYCQVLLPQEIGKLINLRHLRNKNNDCYLPKGIGRLSCLRTFEWFRIHSSSGEEIGQIASLGDLKNLKHLRGSLHIRSLFNVIDVDEAKQAQLKQMDRITTLNLDFSDWPNPGYTDPEKEKELSEALEPSPNLEDLCLWGYSGPTKLPSWIESLTNLRRLEIGHCHNWEYLPCLGKFSSLESLVLGYMDKVKKVGNEFLGVVENNEMLSSTTVAFPNLNALKFDGFSAWEEWDMDGINLTIMPRIKELNISRCFSLKKLPDHLRHFTTLHLLSIAECYSWERAQKYCPILEERRKISHIPNIKIDDEYVQKEGKPTGRWQSFMGEGSQSLVGEGYQSSMEEGSEESEEE